MMKSTLVNLAHQDVNGAQVEEMAGHNSRYICITEVGCLWTAVHKRAISTMAEFSNSCQDEKNASVC